MKKFIACVLLMLGLLLNANAQTYKNEISVEYSQFTIPQFVYTFSEIIGVAFTLGYANFDNQKMTGAVGVEYNRWANNWFGYGGAVFGEYMTADTYSKDSDGNLTPSGQFNMGAVSLMPMVKFRWFDNPHFGMYSKLGAGGGVLVSNSNASIIPVVQVSPICMDFGGESFRGAVELGAGSQGVVLVGVKKRF